jgi:CheY-like chemotaxis protein
MFLSTTAIHPKILLLAKPGSRGNELLSQLSNDAEIRLVESFDDALAALRDGVFDLVVSDQSDFMALERAAVNQQATMILESIGQGVCIVNLQGRLVWANPQVQNCPDDLIDEICSLAVKSYGTGGEVDPEKAGNYRARRLSLTAGHDQHFEVTLTPVLNTTEAVTQVAAVVWDVTQTRRLQKKIDAIDVAGRELVRLDANTAGLSVDERISVLEQKMLRYMRDLLHFDDFAVLLIDKKTNRLEFVLQHGMTPKSQDYEIYASAESSGISGYVAATGRSYICHDTSKDPRYLQGLESAKSSLTVPLRLQDRIIGVLNIESDRLAAFNEDDRQYAEILARYVAIAINILDLLIVERYESSGRLADDVSGEIAGPLNDIVTEAKSLMDEYIGKDDLRQRLATICDNVEKIKKSVREVACPTTGLIGLRSANTAADPLLEGKRVLVADDEEMIRETIADVLRKAGCIVDAARDGAEAVGLLGKAAYDLLLADIRMPHKNGYEVWAAAKEAHPAIAVMLMTGFGYDPTHSIVRARKEGLNAVLFKPFKVDQLLEEVHKAVASPC